MRMPKYLNTYLVLIILRNHQETEFKEPPLRYQVNLGDGYILHMQLLEKDNMIAFIEQAVSRPRQV